MMIESGEKPEEYRNITPYYMSRFKNIFEMYPYSHIPSGIDRHTIRLRNGYAATSPTLEVVCTLDIGAGKENKGFLYDATYVAGSKKLRLLQVGVVHEIEINMTINDTYRL